MPVRFDEEWQDYIENLYTGEAKAAAPSLSRGTGTPEPPPVVPPSPADPLEALTPLMHWGYSREALYGIAEQKGWTGLPPAEMAQRIEQQFRGQYGAIPEDYPTTGAQWRMAEPAKRAAIMAGLPWGAEQTDPTSPKYLGPHPWAGEWEKADAITGELMVTMQGQKRFYPVETVAESGYWLPGKTPGSIRADVSMEKLAKRYKLGGTHELVDIYGRREGEEERSLMQRAAMRARGAPGYQYGVKARVMVPMEEVMPSGMGMIQRGLISSVRAPRPVTVPLPEGFEPTEVPTAGTTWDIAAGEQVIPYKGAAPLKMGAWETARLTGEPVRTEKGISMPFERVTSPEEAMLKAATGGAKAMMPVGDIEALTGRKDIQMILPHKVGLGMAWMHLQAQEPEALATMLGVEVEDIKGRTWQELGPELVGKFREAIPGMTQTVTVGGREVQALVMDALVPLTRAYPGRAPKIPYREMTTLQHLVEQGLFPKEALETIERGAEPTRRAYGGVLAAAAATTGEFEAPREAVAPSQEEIASLVMEARVEAQRVSGAETMEETPLDVIQRQVIERAQARYGGQAIQFGEGQYLASAEAMQRFAGPMSGLEAGEGTRFGRAWAGAWLGQAGAEEAPEEAQEAVQRALGVQREMAGGRQFLRTGMAAFLGRRGYQAKTVGSEQLRGAEIGMSTERVLRMYGVRPEEETRFLEEWEAGEIRPTVTGLRFPTGGGKPLALGLEVVSPGERRRRGMALSERTPLITSEAVQQAAAGDYDGDEMLMVNTQNLVRGEQGQLKLTGGVKISTPEQVEEAEQQALSRGAAELGAEYGRGPGTPEAYQALLDPSKMPEYTQEQIREAFEARATMQEKIGPAFNVLEAVQRGAQGFGEEAYQAGETLFGATYGIMQRPEELPPQLGGFMAALQGFKPETGGYVGAGGGGVGEMRGFGGMAASMIRGVAGLTLPGSLPGGKTMFAPGEAAALISTPETKEEIERLLGRYQETAGTGRQAGVAGELLQAVGGRWGVSGMGLTETPMGAALGLGYRRLTKRAGGEGERAEKAQAFLQRMRRDRPEMVAGLEAEAQKSAAWQAGLTKFRAGTTLEESLRGMEREMPEMAKMFGIQSRIPVERPTDVQMAERVSAAIEAAPAVEQARAAVVGPGPVAEKEAEGDIAWAGLTALGGLEPGRPELAEEDPFGPVGAIPGGAGFRGTSTGAGMGGRRGGPPATLGGVAAPEPGERPEERYQAFMERMFGVSKGQFEESVQGLVQNIDKWSESILPKIQAGEDLTRTEKTVTRRLADYAKTVEKAVRQGGGPEGAEGYWGAQMAPTVGAAGELMAPTGPLGVNLAALQTAQARIRIGEIGQMMGGDGGGGPGLGQQVMGGIQGMGRGLLSGWGMMRLRRWWGMTGGYAMGQIPQAAQQEQAMAQAAMVGIPAGQYQPSPMAMNLMTYQAGQQQFGADVGKAAYGGWGWAQQAGGRGLAQAAGTFLPAVGGGLIAGQLASWAGAGMGVQGLGMAVGAPVMAGLAGIGAASQIGEAMSDRERMAVATAGGGSWWERAIAGPMGLGMIEGRPGLARTMLGRDEAFFGRDVSWAGRQDPGTMRTYGQQIMGGELEGLEPRGRMASIQYAAEQATGEEGPLSFMTQTQAAGLAGQVMRYTPGATNIQDIMGDPAFRTMALRGEQPGMYAQQAAGWGMGPASWQQMQGLAYGMAEPQAQQWQYNQQFYAPFARFGMTPEQGAQMPNIENAQQGNLMQRLAGGSQMAWSQFGLQTGNQWAVTQDPTSGMGIGTNWGGDILGGRMGQVGAPGRTMDIQGGQITFNVTGQQVRFNQWDIEDFATQQGRGYQDWQYGFQAEGMGLQRARQTEMWGFEDQARGLSRGYQQQQFGFQREQMGMSDRQFRERWGISWERAGVQEGWQREDMATSRAQQQTRFGWQLEDIEFQGAKSSLQFGWQMEDLEESERFATGRQRRGIRRQRERASISFGMGMGQLETQEGRTKEQMRWADDAHNKAQQRFNQTQNWRRQELTLQLSHHEQRMSLQRRRQGASETYFRATSELQDKQTKAARDYWDMNFDRQKEAMEKGREYQKLTREIQDAQTALRRAQQLQINEFRAAFESGGKIRDAWSSFVEWAEAEIRSKTSSGASSTTYLPTRQHTNQYGRRTVGGR